MAYIFLEGGEDYGAVTESRVFESGSTNGDTVCVPVSIIDNLAFEKRQSFYIIFAIEFGAINVVIHLAHARVYIIDNDRKLKYVI